MRTCKLLINFILAGSLVAGQTAFGQSFDPRSLSPDQLEKLSNAQAQGGTAGKARPQASPVSAALRQPAAMVPVPGFSQQALRPFGEALFSGAVIPFSAASDMPVPVDYVIGAGDTVELRMFGKENKTYQLPVDRSGAIMLPDIGPLSVAGMTFESAGKLILERIARQKIGVEATVSMGALRSIQVFLMGDVNNPGAYATDALTTVINSLLVGGGIKPTGSMRKVEIRRQGTVVARIDLYDAMLRGGEKANARLQSGDTIFVPPVGRRVGVSGDVQRPAIYELLNEKSAEEVIQLAGGLLPTAYPAKSKLDRVSAGGGRQAIDVALANPTQRRFEVRDGDVLTIPSVVARWDKSVTVLGSVDRPGAYEWHADMHLGELIRSFDQLPGDAYRSLAIIERMDRDSGVRRMHTVNLLNVINGKRNEVLQASDRIFVLSLADVEFLSSASVQYVLAGRLPPADNGNAAVQVSNLALTQADATSSAITGIDQGTAASSSGRRLAGATQAQSEAKAVQAACGGLVELSDIISREGSERFRAAQLNANVDAEKPHLIKKAACPALFDQTPELLPFVLENTIALRGELKNSGILPIPEGMSLDVAINARGGFTREADVTGVELTRMAASKGGNAALKRHLVKPEEFAKVSLEPGNIVLVRKRFSELDSGLVRVAGEFVHPGNYEIRRGEKLSELMARAGGVTTNAYPYGAVFLRQRIKEEKRQFYQKASLELQNGLLMAMTRQRAAGSTSTDGGAGAVVAGLVSQMKSIDPVGRMVIEADPTVLQVRPEFDVVLEAGDEIVVPRRPASILVVGEVQNPGAVQFQSGKKASEYLADVGGTTRLADEDRIFAILPNGSAEPLKLSSWNFQPKLLPPGSTIYVSREMLPTTSLDILMLTLQVVKDLALAAASLSVISK